MNATNYDAASEPPSFEDRLRTNYSETGVAVMQALYSSDYLSIGGATSTIELAQRAGVTESTRVLDVGCGVGGPMLHLAATIGCTVVGIDLVATSVTEAQKRASERGLDALATFSEADALAMPFGDGEFDVVWGQDAWCHIPDKAALLVEAHRVLRPAGTVAFTDWLRGNDITPAQGHAALEAALSPTAATSTEYVDLLTAAGFSNVRHQDISETFLTQYQDVCARLERHQRDLVERFGSRVYEIVTAVNTTILSGFETGAIAGGRFLATA